MDTSKHTLKHTLGYFNFSRSTLYKHMKKQGITPTKEGRNAYITDKELTQLKHTLKTHIKNPSSDPSRNTGHKTHQKDENLTDFLQKQLEKEQEKNKKLQEENKNLVREVGRWEGVARTLQDQNQKLLELKTEDEEADTVEAEIVEPEPAPEKKAEKLKKQGFFQKLFKIKY